VVVLPAALASGGVCFQDALDPVEQVSGDERRMCSLTLDAFPADDAGVHGVPEHPVDRAEARRAAEAVREALLRQLLRQRREGQRADRVALERPHDDGSLVIGLKHRLAAAPRAVPADVPVPERSADRPAALGRLLIHALSNLLTEVGRVELGDRGEDPLHELSRGRVLQALRDRVKLHACLTERGADRGVVLEVPGEPIELVDHQAVD
jgi:hypothetical protein